ncbi:MAG: UvrD-helicase domain-containing protein [Deltaproteobacteria bacterium]|nr:UvrD-helicase domain-containing protein [Deltaproteobacteria bacterium]
MSILKGLNPAQEEAVVHSGGPLLVLAGAGSGKTRVLTTRIAHLVADRNTRPDSVFAVTFTNKAANEMKTRLNVLMGSKASLVWLGTFHSLGMRILKREAKKAGLSDSTTVYDDGDQLRLIKEVMEDLGIGTKALQPKTVLSRISQAKNEFIEAKDYLNHAADFFAEKVAAIYEIYQRRLESMSGLDYGDLICRPLRLFKAHPEVLESYRNRFEHVLVDEYQDTNKSQYIMMNSLASTHRNLTAVGDPDQSIYAWRGADIRNILGFEEDWADSTILRLEQNYRSTKRILGAANAVIQNNRDRYEKNLWTDNAEGKLPSYEECPDEKSEAEHAIAAVREALKDSPEDGYRGIAVFYRTNAQSRVIEERLIREHMPYAIVGGTKFYDRMEVKDALAYLRVVNNPKDSLSLRRIINVPARGIGEQTLDKMVTSATERGITLYEAFETAAKNSEMKKPEIAKLFTAFAKCREHSEAAPLHEAAMELLESSGYIAMYEKEDNDEAFERIENIHELISAIRDYEESTEEPSLQDFLEKVALVNDADSYDETTDKITLMTVHSAKGLEFDSVIIVGLEERVFPHFRSMDSDTEVEEERRICYVAMTRARKRLFMLSARSRNIFGELRFQTRSRFVDEIPKKMLDIRGDKEDKLPNEPYYTYDDSQIEPVRYEKAKSPLSSPAPAADSGPWKIGARVEHPDFGVGVILAKEGSGDSAKVTVRFQRAGQKKLSLKHAPLTVSR